ncbi:MAG: DUF5692 family protein [Erysipelotrichaceae bacterium]
MILLSILSLSANVAVLCFQIFMMKKTKKNPLKEELYSGLKSYTEVMVANNLDS